MVAKGSVTPGMAGMSGGRERALAEVATAAARSVLGIIGKKKISIDEF